MLGKGKGKGATGVPTLIAANARVVGDIHFTGGLHIEGHVQGNLLAGPEGGEVIVGEGGLVEGEIHAPRARIGGEVRGDIHASEHLQLVATAVVTGNLHYRLIEIVVGARINGVLRHTQPEAPVNT